MSKNEYGHTEIPLIPGALYGMRNFAIHEDGTLGPLHRMLSYSYTPGVNVAECDPLRNDMVLKIGKGSFVIRTGPLNKLIHDYADDTRVPVKDCSCGFYAYFGDTTDTQFMAGMFGGSRVQGIVRATGKCLVGDLGFKSEKLEIVGLVCDEPVAYTRRDRFESYVLETSDKMMASVSSKIKWGMFIAAWVFVIVMGMFDSDLSGDLLWFLNGIIWTYLAVEIACFMYSMRIKSRQYGSDFGRIKPSREVAAKIREQYPDIDFFSSMAEAKEKYPLSKSTDLPT